MTAATERQTTRPAWLDAADDATFRAGLRAWIAANQPEGWRERMRGASEEDYVALQREWFEVLRRVGLHAANWAREWGGAELSLIRQAVVAEELAHAGAPQLAINSVALHQVGVTLLNEGTDAQRERHLGAIVDGEIWCQGFSEPAAGSDLAALQTTAVATETGYRINGQKIWSSYAQYATYCLLLALTDPAAPKRRGISALIVDLRSPGIEVRPIIQSTGQSEFCEIFLTDVEVPRENLVGAENDGWRVAQRTLAAERGVHVLDQVERLCVTRTLLARRIEALLPDLDAAGTGQAAREELGGLYAETEILRSLCWRVLGDVEREGGAGPEASLIKLMYSETLQRLADAGVRWAGLDAQIERPLVRGTDWESGDWLVDYLGSWAWTVGGGTSEILRNIVAERVLGLPREPQTETKR